MVSNLVHIPGYKVSEELYNGSRTLVYRGYREINSLPVVIKLLKNPYPSFSELVQFRNQYTIATNLRSPLIVQTYSLEPYQNGYALVMEDFGGISLKDYFTSDQRRNVASLEEFFKIAITLCNTLDILYRERIIHKDIKPANILINPETKQVKLIDFSIASLLPRETQTLMNSNVLEGTLSYISPEQTGRMNRGIDYRTDFYSLGVTFYELLTGELPFKSNDPMELVHCHLAKLPPSLWEVKSEEIPQILSDIVMKLMAKNAEDRYQSALGLKFDLENCLHQLQVDGKIKGFEIAQRDVCDRFIIPDKLYGRETEVETLLQAFDRVSFGATEMMLVAGFSGIGKTVVVNEIHKPIVKQRGYFIKGKYDQFQRNIPFSAFVQAFRDLMGQLLTESNVKIQQFKNKILAAIGDNGQVIIEVIPELEKIIGQQPPATELSGSAAQNRFNFLFQKFTQVFTSDKHPLVIFLDDLQWADSASLMLMQLLMADTKHLFLIGAYRDNEVNPAHPLMLTLNDIQKTAATINTITLAPLSQEQVNQLVADTLKCTASLALPLSQLVFQKTQGNPFFAIQFLKALHHENLIQFNFESGCWQCDIAQINEQSITDDIVTFMGLQLRKLPPFTQNILQLAACIGNQFDLATLAIVAEQLETETSADLWQALQEGLILPISDFYKLYQGDSNDKKLHPQGDGVFGHGEEVTNAQCPTPQATGRLSLYRHLGMEFPVAFNETNNKHLAKYRFSHDRVQQAAYSLISENQKQLTHLKIGQRLLNATPAQERDEKLFEIVNQLNQGVALITTQTERYELVMLNFAAGQKAKSSTAYVAAMQYLNQGIELLTIESWQHCYEITLALYELAAEVACLSGDFELMEQLVDDVLHNAQHLLNTIKVYEVKILAYVAQSKQPEAIKIALTVLELFGIVFPTQPSPAEINQSLQETQLLLNEKQLEELLKLPEMTDPETLAVIRILAVVTAAVYQAVPPLLPMIVCKQVCLSIQQGNATVSTLAYAWYGVILCITGEIELGNQAGQLALDLLAKSRSQEFKASTINMVYPFVKPWKYPLQTSLVPLLEGYQSGLEMGALEYAAYCAYNYCSLSFFLGKELTILEKEMAAYSQALAQLKQEVSYNYLKIFYQSTLNLGSTSDSQSHLPWQFQGVVYNEAKMLPLHQTANDLYAIGTLYVNKLILCYLFQEWDEAIVVADYAQQYLDGVAGCIMVAIFYFYDSLTQLAILPDTCEEEQERLQQRVLVNQQKLKQWTSHAPMNFQHKYSLVEAEKYRVYGQKTDAMELYDLAIQLAQKNQYLQEEALANELAAKFYLDWGREKVAQTYIQEAYYCYARWGAKAKIEDLEKRYPQLLQPILQQRQINFNPLETIAFSSGTSSSHRASTTTNTSISNALDFTSILKAAQTISSSLELDQLIASLNSIILENSGAKKAVLILPQDDTWQVRAITFINHEKIQTILEFQLLDDCQDIPIKVINYVKNTQKTVVIDNCKTDIIGLIGEYMHSSQPQSVLCTPIINQGRLVGILYLENQLTQGVFTSDRLSVINFLCTQAAIALENAQLYNHLQEREKFLSSIYEGVGCLIFVVDARYNGSFEYTGWSKSCELVIGIPAAEVLGKTPQELIPSDEGAAVEQKYLHCFQTGILVTYEECLTFNGEKIWFLTTLSPLKDETGKVYRIVGTTINITDRKQAEEAVTEKSQALGTVLEDLQQAQLQIVQSEKMSALGNLVAGVAHEMNNPLGFIAASLKQAKPTIADVVQHLKLYQQSLPNPGAEIIDHAEEIDLTYSLEDLPKAIDSMVMACDRLKNISTSLRTFSRADKDYKVPFNIHEGIDSTILILKHRLKPNEQRPAIEVITEYAKLPKVECFPGQLNQVFMNILANAIDALDESNTGRSFGEIQENPHKIIIKTVLKDHLVEITIADNANGMNEEVKEKIFDHLFTTKSVGKGTGLGLAIARQIIVEKHGGSIQCNSSPGQGTEFIIAIPVRQ
ncbi:MAG: AAA family ATPase [Nostoc sp.]|uniref:AAA family ATPase n=1 Tax=Nostoc sp. TaxID=1180 RepID=UPI002FFD3851